MVNFREYPNLKTKGKRRNLIPTPLWRKTKVAGSSAPSSWGSFSQKQYFQKSLGPLLKLHGYSANVIQFKRPFFGNVSGSLAKPSEALLLLRTLRVVLKKLSNFSSYCFFRWHVEMMGSIDMEWVVSRGLVSYQTPLLCFSNFGYINALLYPLPTNFYASSKTNCVPWM